MSQVKTILYVEDDLVVLTAHQKCLEHAGYHVIPARDGLEAMKRLSMFVPDLLLLDLVMPRFKGEEVLEFIRSKPALVNVPVIVLSTNSVTNVTQEYLLEGVNQRLIKSHCTAGILLAAVENALTPTESETALLKRNQIPVSLVPASQAAAA